MNPKKDTLLYSLSLLATLIAFCVVLLGAYTRLTDAGLGCPDWPGCYGHLIVPQGLAAKTASMVFGGAPIEAPKAWAEMTHRYLAGTLGILILLIALRAISKHTRDQTPIGLPILISLIVILQASLGRYTVTLKLLPPIVMFHLLGGMTLTALLLLLTLRLGKFFSTVKPIDCQNFRGWALLGLLLLIVQIILGGWTSANYAALVCTHFPYCGNALIPTLNFNHAFTILDKIGTNYQGGVLDETTRITIQMVHRLMAIIVFCYWLILCLIIIGMAQSKILLRFATFILLILILQIGLGIMNVVLLLPLHVAISHNAMATLLLATIVALNYALYSKKIGTAHGF